MLIIKNVIGDLQEVLNRQIVPGRERAVLEYCVEQLKEAAKQYEPVAGIADTRKGEE